MEYIICNFIQKNRKVFKKEAFPKRRNYNRITASSAARLLEVSESLLFPDRNNPVIFSPPLHKIAPTAYHALVIPRIRHHS